jgi:hypothetical protein
MNRFTPNHTPCGRTRREFLWEVGGGFAGLALIDLLSRDSFFEQRAQAATGTNLMAPKASHFPARAKHAVFLFMNGAPSQVDIFDYKPALTKFNGTPYKGDQTVGSNGRPVGHLMRRRLRSRSTARADSKSASFSRTPRSSPMIYA